MVPLEKPFRDQACLEHPLKALELKQTKAPNAWTSSTENDKLSLDLR